MLSSSQHRFPTTQLLQSCTQALLPGRETTRTQRLQTFSLLSETEFWPEQGPTENKSANTHFHITRLPESTTPASRTLARLPNVHGRVLPRSYLDQRSPDSEPSRHVSTVVASTTYLIVQRGARCWFNQENTDREAKRSTACALTFVSPTASRDRDGSTNFVL